MTTNSSLNKKRHPLLSELYKNRVLYLLILFPLALLIIFRYTPMYGIQIAFRDYKITKGITGSDWVGMKHFVKFLSYYKMSEIFRNTLIISFYGLLTFPLPLMLALMLNYLPLRRFKKTLQMLSYAPHFISTVVFVGIIMQFTDPRTGLLNAIGAIFGADPVNYMAKPEYFYHIYVWSGVWKGIGYSSIIYIAALSSVPTELHEAAIVDGANIFRRIWHVDIPSVMPTLCILLVMSCGSLLNTDFEKILLMQNNLNSGVSEVISTYTYKVGLANSGIPQYSYSTAIGLFTSLINLVMLVSVNFITNRLNGTGLW